MEAVHLFDLASRKTKWLSVRQSAIAENIANVDTPRYRARDVQPFSDVMDKTRLTMTATQSGHLDSARQPKADALKPSDSWKTTVSGNSVSTEQELMKAGDVSRDYALTTSIVKSFHRMILQSIKG
ncbi:flagellar basal body rod protein FlgB [Salinarimonas soli]|uniref:Flagellar basal body rod protein FlgB n=1 Tax=Salinarimonas soli TaxID=1638099 RepID=A0A5B2V5A4_9HYPH|nr:flagellar basal body rod protein FlgB [Salinarimonas soli]KAA2234703.1 flagellar basal body rod protein FlgB [Salinarimonas soli]